MLITSLLGCRLECFPVLAARAFVPALAQSAPIDAREAASARRIETRFPDLIQNSQAEASSSDRESVTGVTIRPTPKPKRPDFNHDLYYKAQIENSLETGWLPNNIPFVFDFVVGSRYSTWPLHYTLVPNIASVRWQLDNIWGWKIFRGNTDFSFSGSYTAIPRGPETRYFAFDYGIRRNFIPPRCERRPRRVGRRSRGSDLHGGGLT